MPKKQHKRKQFDDDHEIKPKDAWISPIYGRRYTKEQIRERTQWWSNLLKQAGKTGRIAVSFKYPKTWRSGRWEDYGDPVNVDAHHFYDVIETPEPEHFEAFMISYYPTGPPAGGCDGKYNDCLYKSLKDAQHNKLPKEWSTPEKFKESLGLRRKDNFPLKKMPDIEAVLKPYKINVTGDHKYTSTKQCTLSINIHLEECHYKLNRANTLYVKGVSYDKKLPLLVKYGVTNICYDGTKEFEMSEDDFTEIRQNPGDAKYVIVQIPTENTTNPSINCIENSSRMLICSRKQQTE